MALTFPMRTVSVCDDNRIASQLPSEIQAQLGELIEVAFSPTSRREFLFSHGTVSYTSAHRPLMC